MQSSVWWAPRRASWWIGVLFAVGSTCFLIGPFPGFVELVGSKVDAIVFFVGSIFFTSAATLQFVAGGARFQARSLDWWSNAIQLVGTLFFNISTFDALQTGLDATEYNRLVWTPDARGSVCFLVSGCLAYLAVRSKRQTREWWIAAVNLLGCIAFGISAIASYVVPSTGDAIDLAGANVFTALGALCFLVGAVLVIPEAAADVSPAGDVDDYGSS